MLGFWLRAWSVPLHFTRVSWALRSTRPALTRNCPTLVPGSGLAGMTPYPIAHHARIGPLRTYIAACVIDMSNTARLLCSEMIHLMVLPNPDTADMAKRPQHGGRDRHCCIGEHLSLPRCA